MSEIKNQDIIDILYNISKKIILPKYKNLNSEDIKLKNNQDLVTSVDLDVENILRHKLLKLLPNSLFVGEESFFLNSNIIKKYNEKNYCWTVDPIDGTSNFVKGLNKFAIMIALTFKEKILQTWIYKPLTEELSHAKLGDGSYINDLKIINKKKTYISEPSGSISSKYWNKKYTNTIDRLKKNFINNNSYKCIGYEYVDIAKGKRNYAILSKLYPWDHIPGVLLVKESEGFVSHFDESSYNHLLSNSDLVVTNSNYLLNEILNLIKE